MPAPPALRIPWWRLCWFSADGVGTSPDGEQLQLVEVGTDAGPVQLLGPAADVSVLLAEVATHADQWGRSRQPARLAVARQRAAAAAAAAAVARPVRPAARRALDTPPGRAVAVASAAVAGAVVARVDGPA